MASPSENAATTRKHVEPLLMVALTLSFFSCVAAFISQFLLPSSDLTCSSRNVVSYCLVLYGLALVLFWGLFLAAITELQAAKNFLKALLTEIGLLQLAFIVIYVTLLFSGRPLGSSECPFANYIFSRSLILQILPLCALFLGLNDHDLFYMSFYIFSQILVMVGLLPSFSYILLINLGPAMSYHVILVSCVVGGSFGLLLCIASTYRDILGESGAKAKTRDTKI